MNDPSHPLRSPDAGHVAYADDLHGWAIEQAVLLRSGRSDLIDWSNIAEELEDIGRNEYRAVESALRILMLHLLKWEFQPTLRSKSWVYSIEEQLDRYRRILDDSPSLKQHQEAIRADAYRSARRLAAAETGLDIETFPIEPLGWNVINNPPAREEDPTSR